MWASTSADAATAVSSAVEPELLAELDQRLARRVDVERGAAAPEPRRIEAAEHEVGVGDVGRVPPREYDTGPGSLPADSGPRASEPPVEVRDRATARADRVDVDHRAARCSSGGASSSRRELGAPVADEAHVVAGAPHVDADDVAEPGPPRPPRRRDDTAGRARADRGDGRRAIASGVATPPADVATRSSPVEPASRTVVDEAREVADDGRADVRVHERGRRALELGWLRVDLVRQRDELDIGVLLEHELTRAQLVRGVHVRVEEHDRDRRDADGLQAAARPTTLSSSSGVVDLALRGHAAPRSRCARAAWRSARLRVRGSQMSSLKQRRSSISSRKPSVTSSPVGAPSIWIIALSPSWCPWTIVLRRREEVGERLLLDVREALQPGQHALALVGRRGRRLVERNRPVVTTAARRR
jgi:hypothetical protein